MKSGAGSYLFQNHLEHLVWNAVQHAWKDSGHLQTKAPNKVIKPGRIWRALQHKLLECRVLTQVGMAFLKRDEKWSEICKEYQKM